MAAMIVDTASRLEQLSPAARYMLADYFLLATISDAYHRAERRMQRAVGLACEQLNAERYLDAICDLDDLRKRLASLPAQLSESPGTPEAHGCTRALPRSPSFSARRRWTFGCRNCLRNCLLEVDFRPCQTSSLAGIAVDMMAE